MTLRRTPLGVAAARATDSLASRLGWLAWLRLRRKRLLWMVGGLLGGMLLGAVWHAPGWLGVPPLGWWQTSGSVPRGLYRWVGGAAAAKVGDVVMLRRPTPRWPHPVLLKVVVGVGGTRYCWRSDLGTHVLDDRPMPPPHPIARDLGVPVWHGCAVVAPDELVGYGEGADSYDSRYYGPVRRDRVWGVYARVWDGWPLLPRS